MKRENSERDSQKGEEDRGRQRGGATGAEDTEGHTERKQEEDKGDRERQNPWGMVDVSGWGYKAIICPNFECLPWARICCRPSGIQGQEDLCDNLEGGIGCEGWE